MLTWHERRNLSPQERFNKSYTITDSGCWQWSEKTKRGVPIIGIGTETHNARRFSFIINIGEIFESSYTVITNCGNAMCVNPNHLDLICKQENAKKHSNAKFNFYDNCIKCGFPKNNFVTYGDTKVCPECMRIRTRNRRKNERN